MNMVTPFRSSETAFSLSVNGLPMDMKVVPLEGRIKDVDNHRAIEAYKIGQLLLSNTPMRFQNIVEGIPRSTAHRLILNRQLGRGESLPWRRRRQDEHSRKST